MLGNVSTRKYCNLQVFYKLQKPLANYLTAFARRRSGFESPRLHYENVSRPTVRGPWSSRSRQAQTRARNARNENTVRTPFQKTHGSS